MANRWDEAAAPFDAVTLARLHDRGLRDGSPRSGGRPGTGIRATGTDLRDRDTLTRILNDITGEVVECRNVPTNHEAFEQYFTRRQPMLVALERGTHSPWPSVQIWLWPVSEFVI